MEYFIDNIKNIFLTDNGTNIIELGKDEHVIIFDLLIDQEIIDREVEVLLSGEGAGVEVYGLFFGADTQNFNSSHTIRHNASYTTSTIITKGVLDNQAKAKYKSLIDITHGSVGCKGTQKEDTLLLSRDVNIEAVPALKIANDNVQASHSVSTTYLDTMKKFYLESRGIGEDEVKKMVVLAHFDFILSKLPKKERVDLESKIIKKL